MNRQEEDDVARRHARALGYAEAMLVAIWGVADDPEQVRAMVTEAQAEIERICKGEPK